jgi:hypothetical protein
MDNDLSRYHPTSMSTKEWEKLERKSRSMIQIYFSDSVLLNVSGQDSTKKLWDKMGILLIRKRIQKPDRA